MVHGHRSTSSARAVGYLKVRCRSRRGRHGGSGLRTVSRSIVATIDPVETSSRGRGTTTSIVNATCVGCVVSAQIRARVDVQASLVRVVAQAGTVVASIRAVPPSTRGAGVVEIVSGQLACVCILVPIGSVVAAAKVNSSSAVSRVAWVDDRWSTIAISVRISARERAVAVSIVVVIVRSARGAAMVTRRT